MSTFIADQCKGWMAVVLLMSLCLSIAFAPLFLTSFVLAEENALQSYYQRVHIEGQIIAVMPESERHLFTLILEVDNEVRTFSGVTAANVTPRVGGRLLIEGSVDNPEIKVF